MAINHNSIFLEKRKHNYNIFSKNFYVFAGCLILFEIFLSLCLYIYSYRSYMNRIQTQMVNEATYIENTLRDVFVETQQILSYVGNEISLYSNNNRQLIAKTLAGSSEITASVKTTYSWTLLDWIDPRHTHTIINSQLGVIQNPYTKYYDSYIDKCRENPWKLQLSFPIFGNTSGMWVIPAGIGVTDSHKKYMGTLLIGFNIAELTLKIQQSLPIKGLNFVVLDDDLRIILQSTDGAMDPKSSFYRDTFKDHTYFSKSADRLPEQVVYKNIEYSFYKKPENFPYTILIGFDPTVIKNEFWVLFIPRLLELYGLGVFCLFLLYSLRKKIFSKMHNSQVAKEAFRHHIDMEMKESLSSILTYSNVLQKHFSQEDNIFISPERQKEFMEKIYKEALNLYTMTTNTLNLEYVNVNNILENILSIQDEYATKKNITLKTSFQQPLLPFYGDELRLKQIILGLTSLSIEYSPKGALVEISATNKILKGKQTLVIIIKDNGFSLSAEDIHRLSEKFPTSDQDKRSLVSHLDLGGIKKLVELHNGHYHIKNKMNRGKIIKLTLPYKTDENNTVPVSFSAEPSNVHWLPSSK